MTRTVRDLELFLEATAGYDAGDVMADPVPAGRIADAQLRKMRVGYFEQEDEVPITAETRSAVNAALEALREQGFDVVPFRLKDLSEVRRVWWTFFTLAGATLLRQMYAGHEDAMGPILSEFMEIAAPELPLTGEQLLGAWLRRDELRSQMMAQMQEVPVFITPVCSIPAFRHRERRWNVNGKTVEYLDAMSYTQWFNVLGNPCVVVPVSQSSEGLPIGIQIVSLPWQEHLALAVAGRIEQKFGWKQPPLVTAAAMPAARA
jgi:Asp-tRNA(Asn)/Glu-tRNA(Gln) amidotransferase A subunit family amidase